jgi:bloom syndrome protein
MATVADEDDDDDPNDPDRELHANGYEKDDFVVSDEEPEEDAFDPPRSHHRPQPQRRQQTLDELGPPISRDARLDEAGLDEVHQDIVQAFVEAAHEVEENLRNKHGLRRALFTELQYREMAIRWTTTVAQMYTIRGVDKSRVDQYGAKFASLVQQFHTQYREMMGRAAQPFSAVEVAPRKKKKREVVDLISDDEDWAPRNPSSRFDFAADEEEEAEEDEEEGYEYGDEEDDEENLESSRYFAGDASRAPSPNQPGSAAVEQWQRRFEELRKATAQAKPTYNSNNEPGKRPPGATWRGGKKSFYPKNRSGKGGYPRSGGGGGSSTFSGGSTTGGISKRKGSVSRQLGRGSASAGSSRSRPAPGPKRPGGGGGGIPSMPY